MHKDTKLILATTCLCVLIGIGAWVYRQKRAVDASLLIQHRRQDQVLKRSIEAKLQPCSSTAEVLEILKQQQFGDIGDSSVKGKRVIMATRWPGNSPEGYSDENAWRVIFVRAEFVGDKRSYLGVQLGVSVE